MRLTTAVVTSTIGRPCLKQAIESVYNQTRQARHYIFIDGPKYEQAAKDVINQCEMRPDTVIISLPNNTGANMYTCSHINAMAPYIVSEDMVMFLDDDNWFENNHVETVIDMVERHNLDWGASLRNIVDNEGVFVTRDESESLALLNNHCGMHHVDTSCMAVRRDVGQKMASHWIIQKWMDRTAFQYLISAKLKGGCTGKFTCNYRISDDGLGNMAPETFKKLGEAMIAANPDTPWRRELIFEFQK